MHVLKRWNLARTADACCVLFLMCCDMPVGVIVSPSSLPLRVYAMSVLFMLIGGGLNLAMGMI